MEHDVRRTVPATQARYSLRICSSPQAQGIVTGHPAMPEIRFDADRVGDFLAFLKTLEQ